jgi:hypothetical protein
LILLYNEEDGQGAFPAVTVPNLVKMWLKWLRGSSTDRPSTHI